MKRVLLALLVFGIFSVVSLGQSADQNLDSAKKSLAKSLVRYVPNISRVDFTGCRISVKVTSWGGSFNGGRSSGSYAGGGFPTDESSASFSTGPDMWPRTDAKTVRYEYDLGTVDVAKIASAPTYDGKRVRTHLADGDLVTLKGTFPGPPSFAVVTKSKDVNKIVDAFKNAVGKCSEATKTESN